VHGEVHIGSDRFILRRVKVNHADVGLDRPGGADDVGVPLGRVPAHGAVFHVEPAIEADSLPLAVSDGCPRQGKRLVRGGHGLRNQLGQLFGIPAAAIGLGADKFVENGAHDGRQKKSEPRAQARP